MRSTGTPWFRWISALVLVGSLTGCGGASLTGTTGGTVLLKGLSMGGCQGSANPLPGWVNCSATVTLDVTKTVSSGYVSVFFDYPDAGSFYHGQISVANGAPGMLTVNVVNDYVSSCPATYATTVDVYDGPESASAAPQLATLPTTLHVTC